jgi:DNA primase large subunit
VNEKQKLLLPLAANSSVGDRPDRSSRWESLQLERQKDHYSHFILRLAFAQSAELRRRFRSAEARLFQLRFEKGDKTERDAFVESLGFDWERVSSEEKNALRGDLMAATYGLSSFDFDAEGFLKVNWDCVHDLVGQRKVLVRGGKAYVPVSQQLSLVVAELTSHLDRALEVSSPHSPHSSKGPNAKRTKY